MNIIKEYFELKKENKAVKHENKKLEDKITDYRKDIKELKKLANGNKCKNEAMFFRKIGEVLEELERKLDEE